MVKVYNEGFNKYLEFQKGGETIKLSMEPYVGTPEQVKKAIETDGLRMVTFDELTLMLSEVGKKFDPHADEFRKYFWNNELIGDTTYLTFYKPPTKGAYSWEVSPDGAYKLEGHLGRIPKGQRDIEERLREYVSEHKVEQVGNEFNLTELETNVGKELAEYFNTRVDSHNAHGINDQNFVIAIPSLHVTQKEALVSYGYNRTYCDDWGRDRVDSVSDEYKIYRTLHLKCYNANDKEFTSRRNFLSFGVVK